MIATAENLARRYGIQRTEVDAFALASFERALAAREQDWYRQELVAVSNECFALPGYHPRAIELPRGVERVEQDSHPRATSLDALARLRPVHAGGVQTAGNSCAVVDGAAAALVGRESTAAQPVLARLLAVTAVGVAPEVMGIGPVEAIRLLLSRSGLQLDDIELIEINEAQGAQVLAVQQALQIDDARLNRCGGSIALGHPLAASGLRLCMSLARQLRQSNLRYGVASACIGGGQGMAVLIENSQCP